MGGVGITWYCVRWRTAQSSVQLPVYKQLWEVSRLAVKRRCHTLETIIYSTQESINARINYYQSCAHVFMLHYLPPYLINKLDFRLGISQLRLKADQAKEARSATSDAMKMIANLPFS